MSSGPDLFVVCKQCGSEVSPYITECPYCGTGCAGAPRSCRASRAADAVVARGSRACCALGRTRSRTRRPAPRPPAAARSDPHWALDRPTRRSPWSRLAAPAGCSCEAVSGSVQSGSAMSRQYVSFFKLASAVPCTATGGSCSPARSLTSTACIAFVALLATAIFGWLLERRHGPVDRAGRVLRRRRHRSAGGRSPSMPSRSSAAPTAAALALLGAWAIPDLEAARRRSLLRGRPARRGGHRGACCWCSRSPTPLAERAGWRASSGWRSSGCTDRLAPAAARAAPRSSAANAPAPAEAPDRCCPTHHPRHRSRARPWTSAS